MALTRTEDGISEPAALRRADGSSVHTVTGSELFTSTRILEAEQRLVATAASSGGWVVDAETVDLALLEAAANGNALDARQAGLVRAMCTSGARLQLAIAPAGAGKTTAMSTLARAWTDSGGQVLGLAPSAAAAAQLHDATGAPAETLAKLTWSIDHGELPDWVQRIDRGDPAYADDHYPMRRGPGGRQCLPKGAALVTRPAAREGRDRSQANAGSLPKSCSN